MDEAAEFERWRSHLAEILGRNEGMLRDVNEATVKGVGRLMRRHRSDRAECASRLGLRSKQGAYLWRRYEAIRAGRPRFQPVRLIQDAEEPTAAERFRLILPGAVSLEFETIETAVQLIRRLSGS
jgi:hypothetical protein